VFLRVPLAAWIVTFEKLIDPATSPVETLLLVVSYLDPAKASLLNVVN